MVLKLPLTDRDVTDNTVDGLSSQQMSGFVLSTHPTTRANIDRLCGHERNKLFADGIRQRNSHEGGVTAPACQQSSGIRRRPPVLTPKVGLQLLNYSMCQMSGTDTAKKTTKFTFCFTQLKENKA
jgi:hypothetical protein